MSNYRIGDMVRLTRIAMGISQEELCDGICSVQTLYRIENKEIAVKKEVYQRLMEKMNRIPEENYAVCIGKDSEILEERSLLENALRKEKYEEAYQYLEIMKEKADDNKITQQYLMRTEAVIEESMGTIDENQALEKLESALALTVCDYEKYMEKVYPYMEQEVMILINIANIYNRMGNQDKCMQIYFMLLKCLELDYMGKKQRMQFKIIIMFNLARKYANRDMYEEAIELLKKCIELSIENNYGCRYAIIYGSLAWSMIKQIEQGKMGEENKIMIERYLRQSYYIAAARKETKNAERTKKIYEDTFHKKIEIS